MKPNYSNYNILLYCWLVAIASSCDNGNKGPGPEYTSECRLLYDSTQPISFEYNEKGQLVQATFDYIKKYKYDSMGYLVEEVEANKFITKYEYSNGLLAKKIFPSGRHNIEKKYEYDANKNLSKTTLKTTTGEIIYHYKSKVLISIIENENGSIRQPYQIESGKIIKVINTDGSFKTIEYDDRGREVKVSWYNANAKLISFNESIYQDGIAPSNAWPDNFFMGFPDEEKFTKPNGILHYYNYFLMLNGVASKTSKYEFIYIFNGKGYPTTIVQNGSVFVGGVWNDDNPYLKTYAYTNCEE